VSSLQIRYAGPRYLDRTVALETGEVDVRGIDLQVRAAPSLGGLLEAAVAGDVDVAEVLLGHYVAHVGRGGDELIALPVFPARRFAQRWLWVAADSSLTELAQLRGARVGWPAGAAGALAWVAGLLRRSADMDLAEVELVYGRMGGGLTKILDGAPPPGTEDPGDAPTLPDQLRSGAVDCVMSPYPVPPDDGGADFRLLLPDAGAHERAYLQAGGIYPILSVVVMRRDVYEGDRWIAWTLADAFAEAKVLGLERLNYFGALAVGLPFLSVMLEEIDDLFDGDAFPYGLERNRPALEEYLANAVSTGLIEQPLAVDELFAREALQHPGVPDTTRYDVPMRGTPNGGSA
jgi:4,5-dihydroxyphthalate decarboxylase